MKALVAIAFCFVTGSTAHAQKHRTAKEEHKSHIEYSLDTVMQKIDDLYEKRLPEVANIVVASQPIGLAR